MNALKKKYIIHAPSYRKSGGVRVLYMLYKELEKRNYDVAICLYGKSKTKFGDYKYINKITKQNKNNDIVIYPEIVVGNPLRFKNVVRYVLFYPGVNGGMEDYHPSEVKFTFWQKFYPDAKLLFINHLDKNLFYKDDTKKFRECYFVHKGGKWKNIPEFENMTEINMDNPQKREDFAKLLRETKTLYSFDDNTVVLDEACMCGCDVKIVRKDGFEDYNIDKMFLEDYSYLIDDFIEITQSMNYKGKIEKSYIVQNIILKIRKLLLVLKISV